ncbi:MAG: hypothetical protein K8T89_07000 [Planctomycetes bacterium]|nr:hypothetical protein [Planctomycetota bacterium]
MKPKITYRQLRDELEKRGWIAESIETENFGVKRKSTVFQNPASELYIILPQMRPTKIIEPIHLLHVRNVLENSGFWESLVRQTKAENGQGATEVFQSLAGIKISK